MVSMGFTSKNTVTCHGDSTLTLGGFHGEIHGKSPAGVRPSTMAIQ